MAIKPPTLNVTSRLVWVYVDQPELDSFCWDENERLRISKFITAPFHLAGFRQV